jgi:hypothetical protein
LIEDMFFIAARINKMVFNFRIIQYGDNIDISRHEFLGVAEWIGGHLWTFDGVDFLARKHEATTTQYSSSPPIFGPIFDDGLQRARSVHMFGFNKLLTGPSYPWVHRKSVDGWPVWLVADGIHSFIADKHKVLHKNSARFGKHRPAVLVVTLSFTPKRILAKLASRLGLGVKLGVKHQDLDGKLSPSRTTTPSCGPNPRWRSWSGSRAPDPRAQPTPIPWSRER